MCLDIPINFIRLLCFNLYNKLWMHYYTICAQVCTQALLSPSSLYVLLQLPDPQASCGEIHFCKLHINRKPLAADLNCSALNLIKDLFFNFVPLPTIIQLLTHYKSTEISICYISMGGESQMSNSVLLPPSKGAFI